MGRPVKRKKVRRRALHPGSWPVRWRLAAVSAGLTLAILLVFGAAIGGVATDRIRDDFDGEVERAAQALASELQIVNTPTGSLPIRGPGLNDYVLPNDATVRVFNAAGTLISQSTDPSDLGPLREGSADYDGMRVATAPIVEPGTGVSGYVQYGRSLAHVNSTVERVWLLILAGVLGGTVLASLAGVAIAGRAMRPIASLTGAARKIAATRDPSRKMPEPAADDEVGELTRTLEEMLRGLDAARSEREESIRKQREFVADASHELRTPLTSVLANLELLQASLADPGHAEDREVVDSALRSSRRMSRLVSDLLLLARADAGRLGKHRRCDLADIAGDAAAEAAPLMGERSLSVDNDHPLIVEGSPDELHRMVLNLLENAAHHTPSGSRVELSLKAGGGQAIVEVADDGPGIPPAMRQQIFDRFVSGDGPADTGGGTGLGLSIVSAVAASHGGSVEAGESDIGGAIFRARIPLATDRSPARI